MTSLSTPDYTSISELLKFSEKTQELHFPGYNYMGPGTHILERVAHGVLPTNKTDAAAMIHDIEYLYLDQSIADKNAVANASLYMKPFMYVAFKIKDLFGYHPPTNKVVYEQLKSYVTTVPRYAELLKRYNVKFVDDTG